MPAPPLLLLLLAPDQPITTGELLAVALDDEPEDTEPDADKAEADAQCQVAGRGGDHRGAAAVVVLTQDTFKARPVSKRRTLLKNPQPACASWCGGGCICFYLACNYNQPQPESPICNTPPPHPPCLVRI